VLADEFAAADPNASVRFDAMCADASLPTEERVRAAFAGALGMAELPDPGANFFTDLGGDSLVRIPTLEPLRGSKAHVGALLDSVDSAAELVAQLTR
jgi:hypothetical protein